MKLSKNDNYEMKPENCSAANSYELEQKMVVINDSGNVRLISRCVLLYCHLLALPYFSNYFIQGLLMAFQISTCFFRLVSLKVRRRFRMVQCVCGSI